MAGLGRLTLDLVARTGNFTQGMRQAGDSAVRETQRIESSVNSAMNTIKAMATTAVAGFSVGSIAGMADTYTGMTNKLKLVTNGQNELSTAMSDTHKIAQSTASEWGSVVDVYTKFQKMTDKLGLSQAEVARITETVTKAVGMSGASADEAQRALVQFSQALNLGLLKGQDLNSVMAQTPGLTDAIAKGIGTTSDKLKAMGSDGTLTTELIVEGLKKVANSVDEDFAKTTTMISSSVGMIKTELVRMVGEFDAANGITQSFYENMTELSKNMDLVVGSLAVGAAFFAGTYVPAMVSATVAGYAKAKQLVDLTVIQYAAIQAERAAAATELAGAQAQIVNTQSTLAALQAERALEIQRMKAQISATGLAASHTRLAQVTVIEAQVKAELIVANNALAASEARVAAAQSASMVAGRGLTSVLFGPVGIGIAIASVAAGYLLMQDSTAKTTEKLVEQAAVADKTRQELLKLQGVQKASAIEDLTAAYEDQNKELRKSELAMGSRLIAIQNSMKGDVAATDISNKARLGTLSYKDAIEQLNKLPISTELFKALEKEAKQYEENRVKAQKTADALAVYGIKTKLAGNEASNAEGKVRGLNSALDGNAASANGAASAYENYIAKLRKTATDAKWIAKYAKDNNLTDQEATAVYEGAQANGGKANQAQVMDILGAVREGNAVKDLEAARANAAKAADEAARKQEAAAKKHIEDLKRQAEETKRLGAERAKLREEVVFNFASDEDKMLLNYKKQQKEIRVAGFPADHQAEILVASKKRYDSELEYYRANLAAEIIAHTQTEEQKQNISYALEKKNIIRRFGLEGNDREMLLNSAKEKHEKELAWIRLEDAMRLNDAQTAFQTDIQRITSKYEFEREQIALTYQYDDEMRNALIGASYKTQDLENDTVKHQVWSDYQSEIGVDTDADDERTSQEDVFRKALEWKLLTQEEYQQKLLESESQYFAAKASLQLAGFEQMAGSMSSIFKDIAGEQSAAYKLMFAVEKGFAIAQSGIAIQTGISKAIALGFPQNIPVIAQTTMEGAKIISALKSISDNGFYDGGYTGNGGKYDPAGIVHKGEGVLTQEDMAMLGGPAGFYGLRAAIRGGGYSDGGVVGVLPTKTLNSDFSSQMSSGEPVVNVYTLPGQTAEVSRNERGEMVVLIKETIDQHVPAQFGDPNSRLSRSVSNNFQAPRAR